MWQQFPFKLWQQFHQFGNCKLEDIEVAMDDKVESHIILIQEDVWSAEDVIQQVEIVLSNGEIFIYLYVFHHHYIQGLSLELHFLICLLDLLKCHCIR